MTVARKLYTFSDPQLDAQINEIIRGMSGYAENATPVIADVGGGKILVGFRVNGEVQSLLDLLNKQLESSQLASDLASRIDLIDATGTGLVDTVSTMQTIDQALITRINRLVTAFGDISGAIESTEEAWANADSAATTKIDTMQTTVSGHTTSIQTQTSSINGLEAKYTVKIDNNGYVSGFGLASTANDATPFSEFAIVADKFSIAPVSTDHNAADGSPFYCITADTTINGVVVPPGVYIKAAYIAEATITGAKIAEATITSANIKDATITAADIADATITNAKIADATIKSAKIESLAAGKITAGTLGAGVIYAGTVATQQLVAGSALIGAALIDSIGANQITAGTITGSTLQTAASGERFQVSTATHSGDFIDSNGLTKIKLGASATTVNAYSVFGGTDSTCNGIMAVMAQASNHYAVYADSDTTAIRALGGTIGIETQGSTYGISAQGVTSGVSASGSSYGVSASGPHAIHAVGSIYGVYASGTSAGTYSTGPTCGVYGYGENTSGGPSGVVGYAPHGQGVYGQGVYGGYFSGSSYGIYSNGNYFPFTGSHECALLKDTTITVGDIMCDASIIYKSGVSDCFSEISLSSAAKQKNCIGVFVFQRPFDQDNVPASLQVRTQDAEIPDYDYIEATYNIAGINAVGEGQINVCKDGGNIEAGDYICTSTRPGKGMKQDDDILHNYTVAKARESAVWTDTDDIRMIACTYHCG